jgi:hypothetical protein
MALSQILTKVGGVEATAAPLHVANCSKGDILEFQEHFACPLRIIYTTSIPIKIKRAVAMDLNPSIGQTPALDSSMCF